MKNFYLGAAIVGAIVPYMFFIEFFNAQGLLPSTFAGALFVNGAAGGFTVDLLITSAVFWTYLFSNKETRSWLYIMVNLTIGLSCALPLYLYMNARKEPLVQ